jgi:hypothetical protein
MAQTSWPFEDQNTTEFQYSDLFRRLQTSGVAGDPATTDLKPFGDSSGMVVKVPAGFAIVRGHAYVSNATENLTVTASAANPRIDLVVLELNPSANETILKVIAGTPAVSPVAPTLTQTTDGLFQLALGTITVPGSATTISAGNVVDSRRFIGTQFGRWTTTTRPASPVAGVAGLNTTTGQPEFWNGSAWVSFLADASVTTAKLADGSVTTAKFAPTASTTFIGGKRVIVQTAIPTAPEGGFGVGDVWISY